MLPRSQSLLLTIVLATVLVLGTLGIYTAEGHGLP